MIRLAVKKTNLDLERPFRISRGAKTRAELVRVLLLEGGKSGNGECCPYGRYGETVEGVAQTLERVRGQVEAGLERQELQTLLPPGAARNALDCALFDLEAKKTGLPVYERLGLPRTESFQTFRTVIIDNPAAMAARAKAYPRGTPLKVKLDRDLVEARLFAIKKAAPKSQILVDANESWDAAFLQKTFPVLVKLGVVAIEQPLPAGEDEALGTLERPVPIIADEACHTAKDLPDLAGKYDAINIKLDKTGGLTGALELLRAAKNENLKIMLGCMVSSSLSIAPIAHLCSHADLIDLDGPLLLKAGSDHGMSEFPTTPEVLMTHSWGRP